MYYTNSDLKKSSFKVSPKLALSFSAQSMSFSDIFGDIVEILGETSSSAISWIIDPFREFGSVLSWGFIVADDFLRFLITPPIPPKLVMSSVVLKLNVARRFLLHSDS